MLADLILENFLRESTFNMSKTLNVILPATVGDFFALQAAVTGLGLSPGLDNLIVDHMYTAYRCSILE